MKRKNPLSENATKKDLKVLEGSLKGDMKILESLLRAEIKFNTNDILTKVDENAKKYRDEILTKMDEVMGEVQTRREEDTLGTYQTAEIRKDVDGHEKRISKLEHPQ